LIFIMKNKKTKFTFFVVFAFAVLIFPGKNGVDVVLYKKNGGGMVVKSYDTGKSYGRDEDNANMGSTGRYDTYVNQALGISFNKPAGWNVFIADGTVYVKPSLQSPTNVFLTPILRAHPKMQALSFIRFVYDMAKKIYTDLALSAKRSNLNNTMAEVSVTFTNKNVPVKGFYMVSIAGGRGIFCGYEDVKNKFDGKYAALRQILKTLKVQPREFYQGTNRGQVYGGSAISNNMGPTIDTSHFVTKVAPDGTMYIACPPEWQTGGGNYFFIAHSPDGGMGVFTSNDHQPKTFDPQSYLKYQLMPWMKCSNITITKTEPNVDYMKMLQSQGVPSKAVNFYGETNNGAGLRLRYGIMVSVTQAYGVPGGYVTTYGAFAVPELFNRNFNTLVAMALSIAADNAVIMGNLRANLDRLNSVSKTISQTGAITISMVRSAAASTDRIIDKYNYYQSGEEARYSPL
jgi:hypothetical protein